MHVTMLETRTAYPDGVTRTLLREGEAYELNDSLAQRFVDGGIARPANGRPAKPKPAPDTTGDAGDANASDGAVEPVNPLEGLNAKDAAAKVGELSLDELDLIPDTEERKGVVAAIEARRAELAQPDGGGEDD